MGTPCPTEHVWRLEPYEKARVDIFRCMSRAAIVATNIETTRCALQTDRHGTSLLGLGRDPIPKPERQSRSDHAMPWEQNA